MQLLAPDAELITDGGPEGRRFEGRRNLPQPLRGASRIASFIVAVSARPSVALRSEARDLNGQPAVVFWAGNELLGALLLAIADDKIARVFFCADDHRLRHIRH